jgi:hypothetical protein
MAKIPNQNDVSAIVDAIVQNTAYANTVLDAVFNSISRIAKAKTADVKLQDIKNVESMVVSYRNMINDIINVLCQDDNGQSRDLHELLGAIKDDNKSTDNKIVLKYKTIDAALQLPKVIDSMFSVFNTLSEGAFGFKALITFRLNLWKLSPIISSLFKTMIDVFKSIDVDTHMDKIMQSLVKQPDIIEQQTNVQQDGEFSKTDTSKTITKQGQLGILDAIAKTFEIINTLNTFRVPNFIMLKLRLWKMQIALTMVLGSILDWAKEQQLKEKQELLKSIENALIGEENKKGIREGGLQGIIQALVGIFALTKRMKLNLGTILMVRISLFALGGIIDTILKMLPKFSAIADKTVIDTINDAKQSFEKLASIFKTVCLIGLLSFAVVILAIPIVIALGALLLIVLIIKGIMTLISKMKLDDKAFDPLLNITQSLKKIMLDLIILGLAAIPAAIAILIIAVFMVGMLIFCGLMWMVSLILEEISEEVTKSLKKVIWMLATLMLVGIAILLFALAAPVIAEALDGHIIPFLMLLGGSLFLMWILTKFAAKFASKATTSAVQLGINIMIMVGALLLCAGALVALAFLAEQMTMEKYGYITVMLLGIIALLAVMTGLGLALSYAIPFISMSIGSFGIVVGLIGVILLAAVSIVALSKLEINFGKYKEPTGDQVVGSGSGVIGNVGGIIDFAKFLRERVKEIGRARDFRKGKRAIRVVKRLVKNIVKIAESLESLQKIELDTKTIEDRVKSVFEFVKDLETKISEWMHPSGEGTNVKEFIINSIKDAWRRARQDRDNKAAGEKLNRINALLKTLTDIATALESISNLKIDEELIKSNLNATFAFIKELDEHIRTKLDEDSSVVDDDNEENLGIVANITGSLKGVMDALNGIKEIKFGDKDYEIIETNMTMMFHGLWRIKEGLDKNQGWVEDLADDYEDSMGSIGSMVAAVAKSVKDFADVNSNKLDKNIKLYERFISSVNTIDIEKVLKTSDMFRQMSEFSNSIKGDFDALADALSEKLLPVLEELKAVMTEIPQKLDEGFQNTSASIGAAGTGAANTTEGIQAQIKRENPNISPAELNAQTQQRMSQQASSNAKGVESKLAEIISILKTHSIKVDML